MFSRSGKPANTRWHERRVWSLSLAARIGKAANAAYTASFYAPRKRLPRRRGDLAACEASQSYPNQTDVEEMPFCFGKLGVCNVADNKQIAMPSPLRPLPMLIFSSRWLQLPLYLGLIVAQCVYVFLFLKELVHLVIHAADFSEQAIMLLVLGLIDVVMISNLLVMVIVGGYETFVSRLGLQGHPDEPEWLSHVNAGVLKVKLAMAIIGISSIHLLRTFIEAGALGTPSGRITPEGVMWQTIIHSVFIVSAIGIAFVDRISQGTETTAHAV
jgi:uncharacterized protein (TIGR00645 family)